MSIFDGLFDSPIWNTKQLTLKYIASTDDMVLDEYHNVDMENSTFTQINVQAMKMDSPDFATRYMNTESGILEQGDEVLAIPGGFDYKEFIETSVVMRAIFNGDNFVVKEFDDDEMFDNKITYVILTRDDGL